MGNDKSIKAYLAARFLQMKQSNNRLDNDLRHKEECIQAMTLDLASLQSELTNFRNNQQKLKGKTKEYSIIMCKNDLCTEYCR